jgi:hypothetical protein
MGRSDAALSEIQAVLDGLRRLEMAQNSTPMLRAQRVKAEILLRRGDFIQAAVAAAFDAGCNAHSWVLSELIGVATAPAAAHDRFEYNAAAVGPTHERPQIQR